VKFYRFDAFLLGCNSCLLLGQLASSHTNLWVTLGLTAAVTYGTVKAVHGERA
jgi:hypothetical protein